MKSDTVVFFGSGPVAATSLRLLAQNFTVEAVITKPQPVHHHAIFPVLEEAQRLKLPVITPNNRQALSDVFHTTNFKSRVGVVIDYGFIINNDVFNSFPLGIINSHFSKLPEWRGADPISFSILSGQPYTAVSLMRIVEKMDEGPLLAVSEDIKITPETTTPLLTSKLIQLSNDLLKLYLPKYMAGTMDLIPQNTQATTATYSRKLTKQDGILDFNKPAVQLEREIRAFVEWPKSHVSIYGKDVIVTKAHVEPGLPGTCAIGTIQIDTISHKILIPTVKDMLSIDHLKPSGKNEMSADSFLRGYNPLNQ
ncbi:MAG: methionyl-tRNA formyltransferase [Candidatus Saccharimonadales bacterium]